MTEESGVPGSGWGGRCGKAGATRTGTVGSRVLSEGSWQGRGPCSCTHSLSHAHPPSHPPVHPFPTHSRGDTSLVSVGPSLRLPTVPHTRPLSHPWPWPHTHSLPPICPLSLSHPSSLLPNCSPSLFSVHPSHLPSLLAICSTSLFFMHPSHSLSLLRFFPATRFSIRPLTRPLSHSFFSHTLSPIYSLT